MNARPSSDVISTIMVSEGNVARHREFLQNNNDKLIYYLWKKNLRCKKAQINYYLKGLGEKKNVWRRISQHIKI